MECGTYVGVVCQRVVWDVCVCAGVSVEVCDGVGSLCSWCGCGMWRV